MSEDFLTSLEECFRDLPDPRVQGRCDHKLIEMIIVAVCAVICGADNWVGVETFGKAKLSWLKHFLGLPKGIPSHDTFGRVFALLDAEAFQTSFVRWVQQVFRLSEGQVVAIDGKTARRSHDQTIGKDAIHLVSAWATANGIVLGQRKVDARSNEITAIPQLLKLLNVTGCLVTVDAMGCQKDIAQAIRDAKADYLLRVKDNQGKLHQDLADGFAYADQVHFANMQHSYHQTVNQNQGRIEIRQCWAMADPVAFEYIRHYDGWADLQTLVRVERERRFQGKVERDIAYYISSRSHHAQALLNATRHHWAIENSFHWVLDVTFGEDDSRIRTGDSPQNFAVLRHLALNILKQDQSTGSLPQKRFKAALDDTFLLRLLQHL